MNQYEIYKDNLDEWRWRYRVTNRNIIGVSSEGYVNKQDCIRSIEIMKESQDSPIVEVEH